MKFGDEDLDAYLERLPLSYVLEVVEVTLKSITLYQFDGLMGSMIQAGAVLDDAPVNLLPSDKFYIYRKKWSRIVCCLYESYLPHVEYRFDWKLEVTPFTLALCNITEGYISEDAFGAIEEHLKISYADVDSNYDLLKDSLGLDRLGFNDGLIGLVPDELAPETRAKQLNLLFRLMNFPPLDELAVFFQAYRAFVSLQVGELRSALMGRANSKNSLGLELNGALAQTYYCLDHSTFSELGLEGLEKKLADVSFAEDFTAIRKQAPTYPELFIDMIICPCCGTEQDMKLPEEVAQYMLLMQRRSLVKRLGMACFEEYLMAYKKRLSDGFVKFFQGLNVTARPRCLILVEGDTEETSIPIIAMRLGINLVERGIKVYNSTTKQKLCADFYSQSRKFPNMKLVCLLDSDAKKERDEISRVVKGNRDKYHLTYIEKGAFEDIFDSATSIKILNDMYPDGEDIVLEDFDLDKTFDKNIGFILHGKKKARFDKVEFSKRISWAVGVSKVPREIVEVLNMAVKYTQKKKFLAD